MLMLVIEVRVVLCLVNGCVCFIVWCSEFKVFGDLVNSLLMNCLWLCWLFMVRSIFVVGFMYFRCSLLLSRIIVVVRLLSNSWCRVLVGMVGSCFKVG